MLISDKLQEISILIKNKQYDIAFIALPKEYLEETYHLLTKNDDLMGAYDFRELLSHANTSRVALQKDLDYIPRIYEMGINLEKQYLLTYRFHYEYSLYLKDYKQYDSAYDYLYKFYANQIEDVSDDVFEITELYHDFGKDLLAINRFEEALEYFLEAQKKLENLLKQDPLKIAYQLSQILSSIAKVYKETGLLQSSYEALINQTDLLDYLYQNNKLTDLYDLAYNQYLLADIFMKKADLEKSLSYIKKSIQIIESQLLNEDSLLSIAYTKYNLILYEKEKKYDISILEKTIKLRLNLNKSEDKRLLAYDYKNLADCHFLENNYFEALKCYDEAIKLFKSNQSSDTEFDYFIALCHDYRGRIYKIQDDNWLYESAYLEAISHYQKAVTITKKLYLLSLIDACIELGDYYLKLNKLSEPEQIYEIAKPYIYDLATASLDKHGTKYAHIYKNLAYLYYENDDYENSQVLIDSAIAVYYFLIKTRFEAHCLLLSDALGISITINKRNNNSDKLLELYQQKSRILIESTNRKIETALSRTMVFMDEYIAFLIERKKFSLAKSELDKFMVIIKNKKEYQEVKYIGNTYLYLGVLERVMENHEAAKKALKIAIKMNKSDENRLIKPYLELAEVYRCFGKEKKYLKYLEKAFPLMLKLYQDDKLRYDIAKVAFSIGKAKKSIKKKRHYFYLASENRYINNDDLDGLNYLFYAEVFFEYAKTIPKRLDEQINNYESALRFYGLALKNIPEIIDKYQTTYQILKSIYEKYDFKFKLIQLESAREVCFKNIDSTLNT